MAKKCKVTWLQMHNMNDVDGLERDLFLAKYPTPCDSFPETMFVNFIG